MEEFVVEAPDVWELESAGELEHGPGRVRHQGRDSSTHVRALVGGELVVGEERQPLVAGRRVQRPEDLVEGGLHDRGQLRGRDICCEHRLQRPHAALAHGRVGVLEAGAVGEVVEAPDTRALLPGASSTCSNAARSCAIVRFGPSLTTPVRAAGRGRPG